MQRIEDISAQKYRACYLPEGAAITGYEFYRAALAEVSSRQPLQRIPNHPLHLPVLSTDVSADFVAALAP